MEGKERESLKKEDLKEASLEELFARTEELLQDMEKEPGLEEAFGMYHKGMELLKECGERLDLVEKKIQVLDEEGETHAFE